MRATWLTDIHLNFLRPLALKAFYERVRGEQPHVLLVTGDIGEADSVARFVDELGAIAPIYFVLGNHDYYRSSIAAVRGQMERLASDTATWLPAHAPLRLTQKTVMLGIDGWGDARCGDIESQVQLSDWQLIDEFRSRVNARLMLLPPHDPQFRRNRERVVRDAERENLLLDWDLGIPEEDAIAGES